MNDILAEAEELKVPDMQPKARRPSPAHAGGAMPHGAEDEGQNRNNGRSKPDKTRQLVLPVDPDDSRAMQLLKKRVKDQAISMRWNLNGLMFIYSILITVIILTTQNVNNLFVAVVAVIGLIGIWVYSSLRVRKLEQQFYKQAILDYAEVLSAESQHDPVEETFVSNNSPKSPLTARELEVLTQVAAGKRNKEIAIALDIKESTVKNHMTNIFEKIQIYDRIPIVLLAIRNGWIKYDSHQEFHPEPEKIGASGGNISTQHRGG
jgi:DNA-binding CsgD family transcriptional regulator